MRILPLPTLKTALALILLVALAAAGYSAWYALSPLSVIKLPVEVEVPLGTGFRATVDQLEHAGIAIHRREFELLARALGQDRDIKAGSYEIAVPLTPVELLDKLTRGDVAQAEVRLIEGWTFAQFRAALNASADLRHHSAELDVIACVLVHPLQIGMRLLTDPAVSYGQGVAFDGSQKKKHLLEDGPYNTYTRAGLPPTPIAMPGLASLKSALHPAKTESLYYVSRGDGSSHFSRNIDEHNRAVSKYQRGGR